MLKKLKKKREKRLYRTYKYIKNKIIILNNIKVYLYLLYYFLVID